MCLIAHPSGAISRARSLESLMEGQNWFLNRFDEISRRSILVCFLSLSAKAELNLQKALWRDKTGFTRFIGYLSLSASYLFFLTAPPSRGNKQSPYSLESLMEGQNWFFNRFREISRRSILVCFFSLSAKAGLNLPPFEISCS